MLNLFKFKKTQKKRHFTSHLIAYIILAAVCFSVVFSDFFDDIKTNIDEQLCNIKYYANRVIQFPNILSEYIHIKKENEELKIKIDELKIQLNTTKNVENELNQLKKSINLNYYITNYRYVEKVLGFDKTPYESFMIISANNDQTLPGKVVISSDGLIGVIKDSNKKFARVMTVCDHRLKVPVKSESERLILTGNDKNEMISKEIRETTDHPKITFNEGEILQTSGDGGFFPANLPVAKISSVSQSSSTKISATPTTDLRNVSYVWIISPTAED